MPEIKQFNNKAMGLIVITLSFIMTLYATFFSPLLYAADKNYMKCWTNSEGVNECGNRIPREYFNQRVRFIDDKGITREVKEKSKTREELKAENEAQQEEEKRLAIESEKQRKIQEHNEILFKTYLTVDDLLGAMNTKLELTRSHIANFQSSLPLKKRKFDGFIRDAANMERSGKKVSKQLIAKLDAVRKEIKNAKAQITIEQNKAQKIKQTYRNDVESFIIFKARQINSKVKTKQQAEKLFIARLHCQEKTQCDDYWNQAVLFVRELSTTKVLYEAELFAVSDIPKKVQDVAMTLTLLDNVKKINAKIILLQIRCSREAKDKDICTMDKINNLLNNFQSIVSTQQTQTDS